MHTPAVPQQIGFEIECPRSWESLIPTSEPTMRWCEGCAQHVFACSSVAEARDHGRNRQCVALPTVLVASRKRRAPSEPPKMVTIGLPSDGDAGLPNVMWLVPLDGPLAGETLRLEPSREGQTIGRESPADIVIPDAAVAPLHARITCAPAGATLIDAGSDGGTYVNERQVAKLELVDNDIIRIGSTRLKFKTVG